MNVLKLSERGLVRRADPVVGFRIERVRNKVHTLGVLIAVSTLHTVFSAGPFNKFLSEKLYCITYLKTYDSILPTHTNQSSRVIETVLETDDKFVNMLSCPVP